MNILPLIKAFMKDFYDAYADMLETPEKFPDFEKYVRDMGLRFAAELISLALTDMDKLICENSKRKGRFNKQRTDSITMISSMGDITFGHTLFLDKQEKRYRCLLDEILQLPNRERLTSYGEALVLSEAAVHSYQHAADVVSVGTAKVSKTTVMNKVHAIEEELPEPETALKKKKKCPVLYVEADEDHIHRQKDKEHEGCMIGKLAYVFEGKEDLCEGRRKLINPHYFAGLYEGRTQNQQFWDGVERFIEDHYDMDCLEHVYLISDGGAWIQTGVQTLYKCTAVIDKFHVVKYINRVCKLAGDEENAYKEHFYKAIYKNRFPAVQGIINEIGAMHPGDESAGAKLNECLRYLENNWKAVHLAFADKDIPGSSTEGHVSSVLSDRMSSRPMGWSEAGSDRMCKLRCYIRNYGEDKVIDLVKARRLKKCEEEYAATGTEDIVLTAPKRSFSKAQREAFSYVECLQASLEPDYTVRKTLAIRTRLSGI
jgi:hypothetical protein